MVNWNYPILGPYLNRGDNGITNAVAHVEGEVARVCGARGDLSPSILFRCWESIVQPWRRWMVWVRQDGRRWVNPRHLQVVPGA